jgi:hypothetical protein
MNVRLKLLALLLSVSLLCTVLGNASVMASDSVVLGFSPAEKTADAGETITLDVVIDTGSTKIRGWQGGVVFDSEMLECTGLAEGGFLKKFGTDATESPFADPEIDNDTGEVNHIGYAIVSQTAGGVSGKGVLCTLTFKVKEDASDSTQISLVDVIVAGQDAAAIEDNNITLNEGTVAVNPPVLSISSDVTSVKTGASFTLEIKIDTSGLKTAGAGLSLTFDPVYMSCQGIEPDDFYTDAFLDPENPEIDNTAGTVEFFLVAPDNPSSGAKSGSGVLCSFKMKAKSKTGTAVFSVEDEEILGEEGDSVAGAVVSPASLSIKVKAAGSSGGGGGGGGNPTTTTPVASPSPTVTSAPSPTPSPSPTHEPQPAASTSPPATTISPSPVMTTPLPARTTEPAHPPETAPTPEKTVAVPASSTPEKTLAALPSKTPAAGPAIAENTGLSTFILKDLSDAGGALSSEYSVHKYLSEDGKTSLDLKMEAGTVALNRVKKPLESITLEKVEISPALKQKIDPIVVFECGPSGSTFSKPLTIAVRYDPAALPENVKENDLQLSAYDAKNVEWVTVKSDLDVLNHTITAEIERFSTFALVKKSGGSLPWFVFVVIGVAVIAAVAVVFWFTRFKKVRVQKTR